MTTLIVFTVLVSVAFACNYKYTGFSPHSEQSPDDHVLDWGRCEESELCSVGKEQSPINLDSVSAIQRPDYGRLEFESGNLKDVKMQWTGHNQVFYSNSHSENVPSSFLHKSLDEPFHLLQYHLHTPSEHTLDGEYYDAEIHLVHMDEQKKTLAVIGIFVKEGNEMDHSKFFETMIHEENHEHDHDETKFQDFDPTLFSQELHSSEYFHYRGSLTTPPCSEGVNWFVMKEPIFASPEQLQRLKLYQNHNSRPIQPVHERRVEFYPEETNVCSVENPTVCATNVTEKTIQPVITAHLLVVAVEKQEL